MRFLGLLCGLVLACLAPGCSDDNGSGLARTDTEAVPPFEYTLYIERTREGRPVPIPGTDTALARRPAHLEKIYQEQNDVPEAKYLFRWLEGQCQVAGATFAEVTALACAWDLPIRCTPDWEFVDKVLGHSDGPGARHLRQALADAFTKRAREKRMEAGLVLAVANAVLARGQLKASVGKATVSAETRAVAGAAPPRAGAALEGRAAAVGAERLVAAGRLRAPVDVSAIQARLVQAEALETGARQTAVLTDLARLRPSLERPPTGVPASEALWRDYVTYWDRRFGELSGAGTGSPRPPPPLTWDGYRLFRARFVRAMGFQQSVSARLRRELEAQPGERHLVREMKRPRMDENVGLRPEDGDAITYVDQFVVDEATLGQHTPRVESFSTKQRDFTRMNESDITKHVFADSKEALAKYGGTVEVRRPGHPLFERQVTVSRVHLVYDEGLLPDIATVKEQMIEEASKRGVNLHFHHER